MCCSLVARYLQAEQTERLTSFARDEYDEFLFLFFLNVYLSSVAWARVEMAESKD